VGPALYFVVVTPGEGVTHCSRSLEPGEFAQTDVPESYRTETEFRCWVRAYNPNQAKVAALREEKW